MSVPKLINKLNFKNVVQLWNKTFLEIQYVWIYIHCNRMKAALSHGRQLQAKLNYKLE